MSARAATASAPLQPKIRLTARAGVLAILMIGVGLFSIAPAREYLEQRGRIGRLEQRVMELERANAGLRDEVVKLQDPEYLERLARECLGMVRPGEIAFVTVPEDGEPRPTPC